MRHVTVAVVGSCSQFAAVTLWLLLFDGILSVPVPVSVALTLNSQTPIPPTPLTLKLIY